MVMCHDVILRHLQWCTVPRSTVLGDPKSVSNYVDNDTHTHTHTHIHKDTSKNENTKKHTNKNT